MGEFVLCSYRPARKPPTPSIVRPSDHISRCRYCGPRTAIERGASDGDSIYNATSGREKHDSAHPVCKHGFIAFIVFSALTATTKELPHLSSPSQLHAHSAMTSVRPTLWTQVHITYQWARARLNSAQPIRPSDWLRPRTAANGPCSPSASHFVFFLALSASTPFLSNLTSL